MILIVMTAAPMFMLTGLVNLNKHFEKKDVQRKYGALTLNLKTDSAPTYIYNWIYVVRRMIYGLSIGFLSEVPAVQTNVQILMSLGNLLYIQ